MENESTTEFRPLILVAEDDDSNFKLIKAIIGKKCDILWAKNGEEIVNLFRENRDRAAAMLGMERKLLRYMNNPNLILFLWILKCRL